MESGGPTTNTPVNRRQSQSLRQEKRPLQSQTSQPRSSKQQPQQRRQQAGNTASRIPTFSAQHVDRRQRPRPTTKNASTLPDWKLTETPGDRLLSSLRALEDEIQDDEDHHNDRDQSSASSASSAIWRSAAPIVADREGAERVARTHSTTTPRMFRLDLDDQSLGGSTISTMSDAESVFERLYRMGMESAEKRRQKALAQKHQEPEWEIATPHLSYTPKMTHSPSRSKQSRFSWGAHTPQKNRISAYTDSHSVTSRTSIARSRASSAQVPRIVTSQPNHDDWTMSSRSTTVATDDHSSNSVFDRLHRNQKRTERLWNPPPFTPTPTKASRPSRGKIDPSPKATKIRPQASHSLHVDTTTSMFMAPVANTTTASSTTPTTSIHDALDLLEELLGDSPRTTTTTAATDDETTLENRAVSSHTTGTINALPVMERSELTKEDEILDSGTTMTQESRTKSKMTDVPEFLLEEDAADFDSEDLTKARSPNNVESALIENSLDPFTEQIIDDDFFSRTREESQTTLEQDLAEIEQIGQALRHEPTPRLPNPMQEISASLVDDVLSLEEVTTNVQAHSWDEKSLFSRHEDTLDASLEEELYEIAQIGWELRAGSENSLDPFVKESTVEDNREDAQQHIGQRRSDGASLHSNQKETPNTTLDEDILEIEKIGRELHVHSPTSHHSSSSLSVHGALGASDFSPARDEDAIESYQDDPISSATQANPEFSIAPTPKRRTSQVVTHGEPKVKTRAAVMQSPVRQMRSEISNSSTPPYVTDDVTDSSHTSSGFLSLDEPRVRLVMADSPVVVQHKRSSTTLVPPRSRHPSAAATSIQVKWRSYRAEMHLADQLVESFRLDFDTPTQVIRRSKRIRIIRQIIQNLNETTNSELLRINSNENVLVWKTNALDIPATIVVTVATHMFDRLLKTWGRSKVLRRTLHRLLTSRLFDYLTEATTLIQICFRKRQSGRAKAETQDQNHQVRDHAKERADLLTLLDFGGIDEDLLDDGGHSLTSVSGYGSPMTVDLTIVQQHRAAATIQNWFRMLVLKAALDSSRDSQEKLQQALESLSTSSEGKSFECITASIDSNLVEARRILRESSSQDLWQDAYECTWSAGSPYIPTDGTISKEWVERRAAALAIHNIVQAYLRGLRRYRRNRKAVLIQREWRRHYCARLFLHKRKYVRMIQKRWRSYCGLRLQFRAVVRIQSWWRCIEALRRYELCRFSIICIQSTGRKAMARRILFNAKVIATSLQAAYRARSSRLSYHQLRSAVSTLQTRVRQHNVKAKFKKEWTSATVIQSVWRSSQERQKWKTTRQSTLLLQSCWRRRTVQVHASFQQMRSAAISIQRYWRDCAKRRRSQRRDFASVQIQAQWRRFYQLHLYHRRIRQIAILQRFSRRVAAMKRYQDLRRLQCQASVSIQALFRSFHAKKIWQCQSDSIIRIQSVTRGHFARRRFWVTSNHIVRLQALARGYVKRRHCNKTLRGTIMIQKCVRGSLARSKFVTGRVAAIMIQATWRGHYQHALLTQCLRSTIILQRIARGFLARREANAKVSAISKIQNIVRFYRVRRRMIVETSSAVRIQAEWRACEARAVFMQGRCATVMLQACFRGYRQRKVLRMQVVGVERIQSWARTISAQHQFRILKETKQSNVEDTSCRMIQAYWRMNVARSHLLSARVACIMVQSVVRMWIVKRSIAPMQRQAETRAAIALQKTVRELRSRRQWTRLRISVLMIQAIWRNYSHSRLMRKVESAVLLQSWWRRSAATRAYQSYRMSLIKLQALVRCKYGMERYSTFTQSVIVVQTHYRAALARERFLITKALAIMIQSIIRGFLLRSRQKRFHSACSVIQVSWRRRVARQIFQRSLRMKRLYHEAREVKAALRIQNTYRKKRRKVMERSYVEEKYQQAARKIQSAYFRNKYLRFVVSSVKVQRMVRLSQVRKRSRRRLLSAIKIQACMRRLYHRTMHERFVSAVVQVQSSWRASLARDLYTQQRARVLMLQAHIRGRLIRRRLIERQVRAMRIQKTWREYRHYTLYQHNKQRRALYHLALQSRHTRTIQKYARAWLKRKRGRLHLALLLQSYWRQKQSRIMIARVRLAVVLIQTNLRRHITKQWYQKFYRAVIVLQAVIRMNVARAAYTEAHHSVIVIQCSWRRARESDKFIKARGSAAMIQSLVRGFLTRLRVDGQGNKRINGQQSAVIMQATWKCYSCRKRYLAAKSASVLIQSWVRGARIRSAYWFLLQPDHVRRELNLAARKIQFAFLLWKVKLALLEMESSSVILHRCMIGQLGRSAARYALTHMNSSMKTAPLLPVARISSPTNIQILATFSAWDRAVDRARITASMVIQAAVRRRLARTREEASGSRDLSSANVPIAQCQVDTFTSPQCSYSMSQTNPPIEILPIYHVDEKNPAVEPASIMLRSSLIDRPPSSTKSHEVAERQLTATITLQCYFRMILARNTFDRMNTCATLMQRVARTLLARKRFEQLKKEGLIAFSVTTIQRAARAAMAREQYKKLRQQQKVIVASIRIQSALRGYTARKQNYARRLRVASSVTMQRFARAVLARQRFKHLIRKRMSEYSATNIQRVVRAAIAKEQYKELKQQQSSIVASIRIQCVLRGYIQRKQGRRLRVSSCVVVQRFARAVLARQGFKQLVEKRLCEFSARTIQRVARATIARQRVRFQAQQRILKPIDPEQIDVTEGPDKEHIQNMRNINAVLFIQRHYRVWKSRRQLSDNTPAKPKHEDWQLEWDPDDLIRQYLSRVETSSLRAVSRFEDGQYVDLGGPCLRRAAESIRSIVDEVSTSFPLPAFVDEIQELSSQVNCAPPSPRPETDAPVQKLVTPVRSNRQSVSPKPSSKGRLLTESKSAAIPQLMDLLKHGRALSKQDRDNVLCEELTSKVTVVSTEEKDRPRLGRGAIIPNSQAEKKVTISAPGESFFEGVSTDIPSPIKGEVVEAWDWTDQW